MTPIGKVPGLIQTTQLQLRTPNDQQVEATLIRYAAEEFNFAAFEATGIACRPDISRSMPKRQAEFLFGRLAARLALESLGCAEFEVPSGPKRQPLWPVGFIGSITHSAGHAAALALRHGPIVAVGIDVESIATGSTLLALLNTVIDPEELGRLNRLQSALSLPALVTLAFSAKEAFFKAAFSTVGRYFDFSAVRVREVDPARGQLELVVHEPLGGQLVPGAVRIVTFGLLRSDTLYTACLW